MALAADSLLEAKSREKDNEALFNKRAYFVERAVSLGFFFSSTATLAITTLLRLSTVQNQLIFPFEVWTAYFMILSLLCFPFSKLGRVSFLRKYSKEVATASFSISAFFLVCLILLNFYLNCSGAICPSIHHVLSPFYSIDFSYVSPILNYFPAPYSSYWAVQCSYLFVIAIFSFAVLRVNLEGTLPGVLESLELGSLFIVFSQAGIYFLDPGWWGTRITSLGGTVIFSWITNEDVFLAACSLLTISVALHYLVGKVSEGESMTKTEMLEKIREH